MAATPRKFQEKIALINERAAQGTAAYEEIMQEVSSLRSQPRLINQHQQKSVAHHHETQQLPNRTAYSGSLPDFSINLSQNRPSGYFCQYPQQGAVSDLISLTQLYSSGGGVNNSSVEPTTILGTTRVHPLPNTSPINVPHRHSHLTPPDMLSRSSSDSSLHQTAYQNKIIGSYRKGLVSSDRQNQLVSSISHQMHKSSTDQFPSSEAPMYNHVNRSSAKPIPTTAGSAVGGPGAGPGGGSLPDLTHVQFIQPMPNPLPDLDSGNPSQYSNRPQLESAQGQYSPRLNGPYMVRAPSRGTSPGPSPRPSPAMDRKQKTKPYSTPPSLTTQRHLTSNKNFLSVPSVVNAQLHMSKAIVTDNSAIPQVDPSLPNNSGLNIFGCPLSPSGSHPTSPMPVPLMDYRNPSSPQISPCASPVPPAIVSQRQTGPMTQYRCSSPDSRGSAPPSPVSLHHSSPASSPGTTLAKPFVYEGFAQTQTANQLNHQFQQITVQSGSIPSDLQGDRSGGGSVHDLSGNTVTSSLSRTPIQSNIPCSSPSQIFSHTIPSSPSHIPPSPTHPSSPSHSPVSPAGVATPLSQHPATPQTPLTPNVPLPRLVVTDQDGNDDKDLLLNEVSEFTSFIFDDYIFKNLSSLGEEELMSVDQILVDTETEESFRRDLRNPTLPQDLLPMDAVTEQFLREQLEAQQNQVQHQHPQSPHEHHQQTQQQQFEHQQQTQEQQFERQQTQQHQQQFEHQQQTPEQQFDKQTQDQQYEHHQQTQQQQYEHHQQTQQQQFDKQTQQQQYEHHQQTQQQFDNPQQQFDNPQQAQTRQQFDNPQPTRQQFDNPQQTQQQQFDNPQQQFDNPQQTQQQQFDNPQQTRQQFEHPRQQQQQFQQQIQRSSASTQTTSVMHSPTNLPNPMQQQPRLQQTSQESNFQTQQQQHQVTSENQSLIQHKGSSTEEEERLRDRQQRRRQHHHSQNQTSFLSSSSSSSNRHEVSRTLDASPLGLEQSPSHILSSLDSLDEVSESLLSYTTQLQQQESPHQQQHPLIPSSPTEYTNQLELELHSAVCPQPVSGISGANSPNAMDGWQQISEPNPRL